MLSRQLRTLYQRQHTRFISTCTTNPPHASAVRSLALPIVFLSVKGWNSPSPFPSPSPESSASRSTSLNADIETITEGVDSLETALNEDGWKIWKDEFNLRGYTCVTVVVDPAAPSNAPPESSTDLLNRLEADLKELISNSGSPFPPLLISSHLATLLAQTYVSSHPATAILLSSPVHPPRAHLLAPQLFPNPLIEFDFEPRFPIGIQPSPMGEGEVEEERLLLDVGEERNDEDSLVSRLKGGKDMVGWSDAMEWMDDNGI